MQRTRLPAIHRPPPAPASARRRCRLSPWRGFWGRWIETVRTKTAPTLRRRCEDAGMYEQIDPARPVPKETVAVKPGAGTSAQRFWDSDFGKVIETAAYCLARQRDPELEALVDDIVDIYGRLQQPDGYLNSWFQRMRPGQRWTNLRDDHELYCAGHMLEGAVAYFQATGKRKFLDIMLRYLEHIRTVLGTGPGQKPGYPGHQETRAGAGQAVPADRRSAPTSSWRAISSTSAGRSRNTSRSRPRRAASSPATGSRRRRNTTSGTRRCASRTRWSATPCGRCTCIPAWPTLPPKTGDASLRAALERLWADLVGKRLYVTGGMGPSAYNEGFTEDYDLPNETAYAETCAAVGLVFWARRMLEMSLEGRYGDMMEQALYNGALSGISLDGTVFFYENPLESRGNHHRWKWHRCPCCPPNIARLLASTRHLRLCRGRGRSRGASLRRERGEARHRRRHGPASRSARAIRGTATCAITVTPDAPAPLRARAAHSGMEPRNHAGRERRAALDLGRRHHRRLRAHRADVAARRRGAARPWGWRCERLHANP